MDKMTKFLGLTESFYKMSYIEFDITIKGLGK